MASLYNFEFYADAVERWLEFKRLGRNPHSIFWHEVEKKWAFWVP